MSIVVLLFALGIVFFGFELFVPGVFMGVLGLIATVGGCAFAFQSFGLKSGVLACLIAGVLASATFWLEFFLLPRTRLGQQLFLRRAITGVSHPMPSDSDVLVGKVGEAITVLAPSGYVSIDGRPYQAFSQDGHAEKGTRLIVNAVDSFALKVSKLPS